MPSTLLVADQAATASVPRLLMGTWMSRLEKAYMELSTAAGTPMPRMWVRVGR